MIEEELIQLVAETNTANKVNPQDQFLIVQSMKTNFGRLR